MYFTNHSIWILTLEPRGYRKVNDNAGSARDGMGNEGVKKAQCDMRYEIIYKPGQ